MMRKSSWGGRLLSWRAETPARRLRRPLRRVENRRKWCTGKRAGPLPGGSCLSVADCRGLTLRCDRVPGPVIISRLARPVNRGKYVDGAILTCAGCGKRWPVHGEVGEFERQSFEEAVCPLCGARTLR